MKHDDEPIRLPLLPPARGTGLLESPVVAGASQLNRFAAALYVTWAETVRERWAGRVEEFLHRVAHELNELSRHTERLTNRVDEGFAASDAYSDYVANAGAAAAGEPDPAKRAYLVRFVANYAREQRPDISLRSVFWQSIRDLSGLHVTFLSELYLCQRLLSSEDRRVLLTMPERSELMSARRLSESLAVDEDLVRLLGAKLAADGYVVRGTASGGSDRSERYVLDRLGFSFLKFLAGEWEQTSSQAGHFA